LNIEDPMDLIIFDVSCRAVGCPEQLLVGRRLSLRAEKNHRRKMLARGSGLYLLLSDGEYRRQTVTMEIA
jgi:hypothetical protein